MANCTIARDPLTPGRQQWASVEVSIHPAKGTGFSVNVTTYGLDAAPKVFQGHGLGPDTGEFNGWTLLDHPWGSEGSLASLRSSGILPGS